MEYCPQPVCTTTVFDHTGSDQTFSVVLPGLLHVNLWGAGGSRGGQQLTGWAGPGGFVSGSLVVEGNRSWTVTVGSRGEHAGIAPAPACPPRTYTHPFSLQIWLHFAAFI